MPNVTVEKAELATPCQEVEMGQRFGHGKADFVDSEVLEFEQLESDVVDGGGRGTVAGFCGAPKLLSFYVVVVMIWLPSYRSFVLL